MNFTSAEYRDHLLSARVLRSEIQMLSLGDIDILGLPGEPFVEIGIDIKSAWRKKPLLTAGYANDDIRYILTEDAYVSGQYETVGTPLTRGAASRLIQAAHEILRANLPSSG
jgi:neutral ceramidase